MCGLPKRKSKGQSGAILQSKALILNNKLGDDSSFTASSGWLEKWKTYHRIQQLSVSEDHVASENYKITFLKLIKEEKLSPSQFYSAGEMRIFFKMLPKETRLKIGLHC